MASHAQPIGRFSEVVARWEDARLDTYRLQQLLAVARRAGADKLTVIQLGREVSAARKVEAQLLIAATECLHHQGAHDQSITAGSGAPSGAAAELPAFGLLHAKPAARRTTTAAA